MPRNLPLLVFVAALLSPALIAENIRFPVGAGHLDVTSAAYGARGDGIADDTAAIQSALNAAAGGRTLYFPNGTYRVTATLSFPGDGAANITLQGQSEAGAVLRLADATPGFTDPANPRPLLDTKGNHTPQRFSNSIRNLTLHTGSGNPGAIGVQYYANNMGALRRVSITSGDGAGFIGLETSHTRANGPFLVKDVTITGFQYGIRTGYALESLVFENVTLRNQSVAGWLNENAARTVTINGTTLNHVAVGQTLSIRRLNTFDLSVPALMNPSGFVVLLDSTFAGNGSASSTAAIQNGASGQMLLRNVSATGYARLLRDGSTDVAGLSQTEWLSDPVVRQFGTASSTLGLPVQETPDVPWDDDPATWANIKSFGATAWDVNDTSLQEGARFDDDAPKIQAAIDSGATTVFIPRGFFRALSPIIVRGNVRRIIGLGGSSQVGSGNNASGVPYTGTVWQVENGTSPTVVIENLSTGAALDSTGVDNRSSRTVVLRDVIIQPIRPTGTGDLFLENVVASYNGFQRQRVWARQFNVERDGSHIVNRGGTLWILGLKTEDYGLILDASEGARTEILGGMIYSLDDATQTPMIRSVESRLSLSVVEYLGQYGRPYNTLVEETANGVTSSLARGGATDYSTLPTRPARWSQFNDGTTTESSTTRVGSALLLYAGASDISGFIVQGNGTAIADGDSTPATSDHTDFGNGSRGYPATLRTFTLLNTGTTTVTLTGSPAVSLSGTDATQFTVERQPAAATLAPGATLTFDVRFTPASGTANGAKNATVLLPNSATPGGTLDFAIRGTATNPIANITAEPVTVFVPANSAGSATLQLVNAGFASTSYSATRPPTNDYTVARSDTDGLPFQWIEIVSGDTPGARVTELEGQDDRQTAAGSGVSMGMTFPMYGSSFSKARFATNGYLILDDTDATGSFGSNWSGYTNRAFPTGNGYRGMIAPYWDDCYMVQSTPADPTDSRIFHKQVNPETFVVTWSNLSFFDSNLRSKRMTFQTVLKRDGTVYLNYRYMDNWDSASAGIQLNSSTGRTVYHRQSGTTTVGTAPGRENFSVRISPGAGWLTAVSPASGTLEVGGTQILGLAIDTAGLANGSTWSTVVSVVTADHPASAPLLVPVTLTVAHPPTPPLTALESWRQSHFGTWRAEGDAADSADPDGDGFANLLEYALGTLPTVVDTIPAATQGTLVENGSTYLTLTYRPDGAATGVTLIPECSGDLTDWSPAVMLPPPLPPTLADYGFDAGQADFNSAFLETLFGNTPSWNTAGINATGGVGNSGFLQTSSFEQTALWAAPRAWSTDETLTVSVKFKARVTAGSTAAGEGLRLGFDASEAGVLSGGQFLVVGIEDGSASDNGQIAIVSREGATVVSRSGIDLGVLTDNQWYELRGSFTKLANAGNFSVSAALYAWGADGQTGGTQVGSTFTLTGSGAATSLTTLWNDAASHVGFRASNASGKGVRGLDSFNLRTDLYPASDGSITARDTNPLEPGASRFMRLRVSNP